LDSKAHMSDVTTIPIAEALKLASLLEPSRRGVATRVLTKAKGGSSTLFAFDAGGGLRERSSPFDAFVLVLRGAMTLTIGGTIVEATPGTLACLPANASCGVVAKKASSMLLVTLAE
jgi:quercetin dioxygenase-like cupin family protein